MDFDYEDLEDAEKKDYALGFAAATAIFRNALGRIPDEIAKGSYPCLRLPCGQVTNSQVKPKSQIISYYKDNLKAAKEFK